MTDHIGEATQKVIDLDALYSDLDFANQVQAWSLTRRKTRGDYGTFGQAAEAFRVSAERIAKAVEDHYWMFTMDDGPLAEREIDHDGE